MERRVLIAIFLSFLVLVIYQSLLPQQQPQAPPASPPATQTAPSPGGAASSTVTPMPPSPPPVTAAPVVGETQEQVVTVETDLVRAEFSNRGATLRRWQLKRYPNADGGPLDLVPADLPPEFPRPFALRLDDEAQTRTLREALFKATVPGGSGTSVDARTQPATLSFEYQDAAGLRARKQFRIDPNSYVITFAAEVSAGEQALNPAVQWGPALGDVVPLVGNSSSVRRPQGIVHMDGDVERLDAAALGTTPRQEGAFGFVGVETQYFLAAAVNPGNVSVEYRPLSLPVTGTDPLAERHYVAFDIRFPSPPSEARFFVGPKDFNVLQSVDAELVRAIWFGMFAWMSVPLLSALNWINGFVGNYGWSIIILTILINAVMFPLRHKSVVSMRKMQEIQPEVKAIQDRYAKLKVTDPARQKMNAELMNLYRERGANPASGCIPMLLTLPVLFAFYGFLSEAIELRGAPFMLWIQDLSQYDPLYVTPVLMGLSQMVQQRMTPTAMDPVQQKMMMLMPIVFTFMFLWVPSGLVLYWLVSNLWAIGQQYLTNYLIGPPVIKAPRPPAERRLKRVGGSKTEAATEPQ